MPFPNEHAARQRDPAGFKDFRRSPMEGVAGVDVIWGLNDGKPAEIQSLRFDSASWTPETARAWLDEHGFSSSGFESAADKEARKFRVVKATDKQQVYGWLYCTRKADGSLVVDHSGETIPLDELEDAAHEYALSSRVAGEMHETMGVGRLIELFVSTPEKRAAMGIPEGVLPDGVFVGYQIDDKDTWAKVRSGELAMFSLGGHATREEVP